MNAQAKQPEEQAAEWCDTARLKPWGRNPRKNEAAVQRVADSIRRFGFGAPLVARKADGRIIAGHTRLKAARLLGLKRVPVRFLDIDENQADMLALADNKLGEIAEWDDGALGKLLAEHSFADAALAGWTGDELGKLADEIIGAPSVLPEEPSVIGDVESVGFAIKITGQLAVQQDVIARVRDALEGIDGLTIECL